MWNSRPPVIRIEPVAPILLNFEAGLTFDFDVSGFFRASGIDHIYKWIGFIQSFKEGSRHFLVYTELPPAVPHVTALVDDWSHRFNQ